MTENQRNGLAAGIIFLIFVGGWLLIPAIVSLLRPVSGRFAEGIGVTLGIVFTLAFPALFWLRNRRKLKREAEEDDQA